MNTGERIKARRVELGISAETLAEAIGVSPSTIYRYESNNIANMGIDKLKAIANVLKTDAHILLGWEITNDDVKFYQDSVDYLMEELSIADKLQLVLNEDEMIGDYKYSDDDLLEILKFARYIKERK